MPIDDHIIEDENTLSTSILHLINPTNGREIDLISSIHIGSPQYYEQIKRRLQGLDYVLHEAGTNRHYEKMAKIRTMHHNTMIDSAISTIIANGSVGEERAINFGRMLKERMKIIGQTEGIDYRNLPANWVECDLSAKEIVEGLNLRELMQLEGHEILSLASSYLPSFIADKLANWSHRFLNKFLQSPQAEQKNRESEAKVYGKLEELESNPSAMRIGVLYGALHMQYIETGLQSRGYVRNPDKPIEYLEALKKRV